MVAFTLFSSSTLLLSTALLSVFAEPSNSTVSDHHNHRDINHHHRRHHKQLDKRANWRFDYNGQKVRGVNLGGWLVLEPWITPSLFDGTGDSRIVDEWTFCQYQNYDVAHSKLVNHWNTWITENDFKEIKTAGLNHVRIPIGYWSYEDNPNAPFHKGADDYLKKAITWAGNVGLKVIIDLHGAPGSQNGFDNSGQRKSYPTWHTKQSYTDRMNVIVKKLANIYSRSIYPQVVAIAPLNEPAGFYGDDVLTATKKYWYSAYSLIRKPFTTSDTEGALVEIIHDAFQPLSYWLNFFPYPQYSGAAMDTHVYDVFSNAQVAYSQDQHIQSLCSKGNDIKNFRNTAGSMWTIVGEWSLASTDCAIYLNGRGVGARYDGTYPGSPKVGTCNSAVTGDGSGFSDSYKTFLRKYWEAQVISYEKGQGWVFWTWKAEKAAEWSYAAGLKGGWIPKNPAERKYAGICG